MAVKIGVHEQEARVLAHFRNELVATVVHLLRIDPRDGIRILTLLARGRAGADFEHRIWLKKHQGAGNRARDGAHQLSGYLADRCALCRILQEDNEITLPAKENRIPSNRRWDITSIPTCLPLYR
jgi:hypothetical protein